MIFTNRYLRLMRLHQPVGNWLLLWPCWWSLALAGEKRFLVYALFALGAVVMRSAGCIINDMADRNFDRQVERTKNRPLASGELSMRQAGMLLAVLLAIAFGIAVMLGREVVCWSALALPLVVLYPLMKRITWWPQLFLGLTFNWGALLGWVAVHGTLAWPALLLYAGCVFWTLGYDTIYAHQDKEDDIKAGVKSTALRLGRRTKLCVAGCYGIFISSLVLLAPHAPPAWGLLLVLATQLFWQVWSVELDNPVSCKNIFITNQWVGVFPWLAMI